MEQTKSSQPYFIAIDIGTSSVKIATFDTKGELGHHLSHAYELQSPQVGYFELDPEVVFQAVCRGIQQVRTQQGTDPLALCWGSAMHSIMIVDADAQPLTPILTWADNRSADIAQALKGGDTGKMLYRECGTPIHAMNPLTKLIWWRQNQPEVFEKAHLFVSIKAYIFYRLLGIWREDISLASSSGLLNLEKLGWSPLALEQGGIRRDQLPELAAPDELFNGLSEVWRTYFGFSGDIPQLIGGSDGCLANLGSLCQPGELVLSLGTSGAIRLTSPEAYFDPEQRSFCYLLEAGAYIIGGATNNGAAVLKHFVDHWFAHEPNKGLPELVADTKDIPSGSEGLVFLPYLLGERAPLWDEQARASFIGLAKIHGPTHLLKAVMEGILLNLKAIAAPLPLPGQQLKAIWVTGGGSRLPAWMQMCADIFGCPVHLSNQREQAAFGTALLGLRRLGYVSEISLAHFSREPIASYYPDRHRQAFYEALFKLFSNFYPKIQADLHALQQLNNPSGD